MKSKRKVVIAAVVLATSFGFASAPAYAQTTAPGPYYATPSWDQTLPANTRFVVLSNFNSQAVLDRETGLVWERTPRSQPFFWFEAPTACTLLTTGLRQGWRLPSVQELLSLREPGSSTGLPTGHPFTHFFSGVVWTATAYGADASKALAIEMRDGSGAGLFQVPKNTQLQIWCVRGGSGNDIQ